MIESAEPEDDGVNVFFTDIAPAQRKPDSPMGLLLHVLPERLSIWPLNVRADRDDYLQSKYDTLERIVVARPVSDPISYRRPLMRLWNRLSNCQKGSRKIFDLA